MSTKKDQKNILIGVLLVTIVIMAVGYAVFLNTFSSTATLLKNDWDVAITDITVTDTQGKAKSTTATYTATTATFAVDLPNPGDSIEYTITVSNNGNVNAKLKQLVPVITGDTAFISYTIDAPTANSILKAGETVKLKVNAQYDSSYVDSMTVAGFDSSKALTITLDYIRTI